MKNIAVMAGGDSSEHDVSLRSAENIVSTLKSIEQENGYHVFLIVCSGTNREYVAENGKRINVDKNDFSLDLNGEKIKFDFAYIIIHGTPGENGKIQGYLDMLGVPYSTGGVLNCSVGFNKHTSKVLLQSYGIKAPRGILLYKGDLINANEIIDALGLPVFVKPNEGGSSFGIAKVKIKEDLLGAIDQAFSQGNQVIVEQAVIGREFTCGVSEINGEITPLPITEIKTNREFFDYEAKYLGNSKEITPADIDEELRDYIWDTSKLIYRKMDCKGIVRIDYIYSEGLLYFIEINLTPGMTNTSLIPQQLKVGGYSLANIIKTQIEQLTN